MLRRDQPRHAASGAREQQKGGKQRKQQQQQRRQLQQKEQEEEEKEEEEEEEEEEFPAGVECEEEYDEEDVYVVVDLPSSVDGEALLSASAVTVKGIGTSTPQLKVGDQVYGGKAEPIIGTTMSFTTPKPGSSGREPLELACFSNTRMTFNQPPAKKQRRSQP